MVTAELACSLLALVVLATGAVWGTSIVGQQLRAQDVASQVARQLARGDEAAVRELLARQPQLSMTADREEPLVVVTVVDAGRPLGLLPAVATTARATAALEPGR